MEAVGRCGVDAGEKSGSKAAPSHKSSCEASRRAECGKSARSVRRGGGWKRAARLISVLTGESPVGGDVRLPL